MAESGDWVTPRLHGKPWFEKPILYYWAAATSFRALGINEFAARLPSALAAAVATLVLAWAAARLYGPATSAEILLLFPTCVGTFAFARAATPDMLFTAFVGLAMVAAWQVVSNAQEPSRRFWCIVFGVGLGAATLAKGPAAIVLAGGSMALWALTGRRWWQAFWLAHPLAVLTFCVVALPWYVLCAVRNPGFAQTFLFAHNVQRYFTPFFRHEQPLWFYAPVLLLGLVPWTVLLVGVARDVVRVWRERRWKESSGFFFACWAVSPVVLFSFSKSKLPGYVLPALPALALLVVRSAVRAREQKDHFGGWLLVGVGATFAALAFSAGYWLKRLPPQAGLNDPKRVVLWLAEAAAVGVIIAALGLLGRPGAALAASAILTAGLVAGANQQFLPQLDPYLSARAAARIVQTQPAASGGVWVYHLQRAWHYGLNFYLERELLEWTPEAARPAWVYTNLGGMGDLTRQGTKLAIWQRFDRDGVLVRIEPENR